MINKTPLWKNLLIIAVLLVGMLYALPNIYGEDPALQITDARAGTVEASLKDTVVRVLDEAGITYKSIEASDRQLLVRFPDTEIQLKAVDFVKAGLGSRFVVALNLAPATPDWLQAVNALPMYLGLDLRGGVHFLMEVDMDAAVAQAIERYAGDFRTLLREAKIRYAMIRAGQDDVQIVFGDAEARTAADNLIGEEFPDLERGMQDTDQERPAILIKPGEREIQEIRKFALQQNILTLRNRVNELGVAEPVIQQQGLSLIHI